MKYQVTITETLSRTVSIEAPSAEIAEEQVRGQYRDEEIVLGSSDFCYFDVDVCGVCLLLPLGRKRVANILRRNHCH